MSWRLPNYDPIRTLGTGRTGTVVLARDEATGAEVAIKFLAKNVYRAPGFADTFRREAARLVHVDSESLTGMYEYVEQGDSAAIVSEYVDGVSLRRILAQGPLDGQSALYVLKAVLNAMTAPHRLHIAHRDLRPENILIKPDAVGKVTDIGVQPPPLDRRSPIAGEPLYRAPELWYGNNPTMSSDVYAAAVILAECIAGTPPKSPDDAPFGLALSTDPEAVLELPADLPEPIAHLLKRCLTATPETRPADASEMLDYLEVAALRAYGASWAQAGKVKLVARLDVPDEAPTAPAAGTVRMVRPAMTRRRSAWVVSAVAGVAVVGIGLIALIVAPSKANSDIGAGAAFTHTIAPIPGPAIPSLAASGPNADTVQPEQITGLKVISEGTDALTLDWDQGFDNIQVTGYIIDRDGKTVGTTYVPGFTDNGLTPNTKYTYTIIAFDAAGNQSDSSTPVTATTLVAPDKVAPSIPTGLRSTGRDTTLIVLNWSPSHDNVGVAGYDVFRNGHLVGTVVHPGFTDRNLTPATTYRYQIRAFDASDNASNVSPSISVTTLTSPDKTPPTTPGALGSTPVDSSHIKLTWTKSSDASGVTGYDVYRDGVLVDTPTSTTYTDHGLEPSTKYSYKVRARDAAGNTSPFSNVVSATTLAAQPPITPPSSSPSTAPPPTDTPTPDPTVTAPPSPTVTAFQVDQSSVGASCTTTVSVDITASGSMSVTIDFTIDGVSDSKSVSLDPGPNTRDLKTDYPVNSSVSISAHVEEQPDMSDSATIDPPADCPPVTEPPSDVPSS